MTYPNMQVLYIIVGDIHASEVSLAILLYRYFEFIFNVLNRNVVPGQNKYRSIFLIGELI